MTSLKGLRVVLIILAIIALVTGALETIMGVSVQELFGAVISDATKIEPVFNSQLRFVTLMWFVHGILFLLYARDMKRYAPLINIMLWAVLGSAILRIITAMQYGLPTTEWGQFYIGFMFIGELIGSVVGLIFYQKAKRELLK